MLGQININNIIDEIKINRLSEQTRLLLVYSITGFFILFNSYLIYKEFYWGIFIPLAIVVALFYLFAYDKVVWLIILLTPFSVYFLNPDLNVGISLPVDPLMFGVMVIP